LYLRKREALAEDSENPWTYYARAKAVVPIEVSNLELLVLRSEELKMLIQ
jgi:hypothetical protein